METKKYSRLTYKERVIIEAFRKEFHCPAYIAKYLKRARSTITNELNLWVKKPSDKYDAFLAHGYAMDSRKSKKYSSKISENHLLKDYVHEKLEEEWSPETIAGRICMEHPTDLTMRTSHETIYKYIYDIREVALRKKLISFLLFSKPKRRSTRGIKLNRNRIKDATSIDDRPKYIELREEAGHWEGDLMIGAGQASAIGTIVERKSRYTLIVKLDNRKSETVTTAFKNALNYNIDSEYRKTMTYDNGLEMANHTWFTEQTKMKVYFAHPYSSWERGTNENMNGRIRRYFPKKTDFNKVDQQQLEFVQNKLNNTPRKVLGFLTPNEVIQLEKIK